MGISTVVAIIIGILAVIGIVLFGVLFGYLYWWRIARAQPRLSGVLAMTGLDAPVDVLRDKHGVPHIYAITRADLFRTQGFVHAQDRMWQMEQNRRIAAGTLAELFGEAALDADRFSRTVGFLRAAQREYDALDDETRAVLSWYAEGVNAYITSRLGRLAPELNLLGACAVDAAGQPRLSQTGGMGTERQLGKRIGAAATACRKRSVPSLGTGAERIAANACHPRGRWRAARAPCLCRRAAAQHYGAAQAVGGWVARGAGKQRVGGCAQAQPHAQGRAGE